jgi:hypothetical protein
MEELPSDNSSVKNISLGIEGILLGLLFFILILLGLNYFRIISLSFLHPMLAILPQKQQMLENSTTNVTNSANNTKTKSKGVLIAEEKAKKAGYSVAWAGENEDGSGRAILASEERNIKGWVDKFGWQKTDPGDGKMVEYRGQGLFERWEDILGSEDIYIILKNPKNNEDIRARIVRDIDFFKKAGIITDNRTRLEIENLSIIQYNEDNRLILYKKIGYFYNLNENILNKYIFKQDIVTIWTIITRDGTGLKKVIVDDKQIPVAASIIIRRFDLN